MPRERRLTVRKIAIKRGAVAALLVLSVLGAFCVFCLHMRQAENLKQQPQDKMYVSFNDPANIPCLQKDSEGRAV